MLETNVFDKIEIAMKEYNHSWNAADCKKKMGELKKAYGTAKLKNGESGQSRHTSPFYEDRY